MAHRRIPPRAGAPRRSPDHRRRADRVHPRPTPLAQKRQILEAGEAPEEYEGDFTRDQEALREEQLVRRTVFMEFSRRLAAITKSTEKGNEENQHAVPSVSPMWADLRFDFGAHPSSTRCGSCTSERRFRLPQPSTARRIFPAQPSTVTPASPQPSSPLTHPSRVRTSTTGWASAPRTSQVRQSSAGHALRTRQASQP